MQTLVSVIMSVYNEEIPILTECINSILMQTYLNFEFVIILDDPNYIKAQHLIENYAKDDLRIRFYKNKSNMGLVKSLNRAIGLAQGEIIARMDADDIAHKERLEKQIFYLDKYGVDFIIGGANFIFENGIQEVCDEGKELFPSEYARLLKYGHFSVHSTWFLKKEIYEKLQGYRDIKYAEDVDFLLRCIQKGYKCYHMKENLVFYRLRETGISQTYALEQFQKAKRLRMYYKKGEDLESINPNDMNELYANIDEEMKNNFLLANRRMDLFAKDMRNREFIKCFSNLISVYFINSFYRQLLHKNMLFRFQLYKEEAKRKNDSCKF